MYRLTAAAVALATFLTASAALACGGGIPQTPGYAGTAVAEGPGQVSVFTASPGGYSWDRLTLPGTTRTHVADITGTLTGTVETDARVQTAISVQYGQVVELGGAAVTPLSTSSDSQTLVFGAALDSKQTWQVVTYNPSSQRLALFSETAPSTFVEASAITAACGSASMLDVVVESDDSLVSSCGGKAVVLSSGHLELVDLPVSAIGLGKASDGTSVFFGIAPTTTGVARMSRSGMGWVEDSSFPTNDAPQSVMVVNEGSVVVNTSEGFRSHALVNGAWTSSAVLDGTTPVTSASGSPAQVYGGQYELTLYSPGATEWSTTDLGAMGQAPHAGSAPASNGLGLVGCQSGVGESGWALMALLALALSRGTAASKR